MEITTNYSIQLTSTSNSTEATKYAYELLEYFHLPLNRRLELYDQNGEKFSIYRYGDGTYAKLHHEENSQNPSKKDSTTLIWDSPNAIHELAQASPQLFASIESRMELKADRIPHPFDGLIHSVQITWQTGQEPQAEVIYTSGVKSPNWSPGLTENDFMDDEYFNIFTILRFPASDF